MFRVVPPPIIRSAYNCIYSIWYLSHHYCYLPLAAGSSNGVTNNRCCRYSCIRSWWWVEIPPETCRAVSRYKLCNVASCWIYIYIYIYIYWTILTMHGPINVKFILTFLFLWRCDPMRVMASSFLRFLDHTQRRITVGRTPLDEWSARRRDLYLTAHNTHNRQTPMPLMGFEPTISAGERPQTYALDHAATGIGT